MRRCLLITDNHIQSLHKLAISSTCLLSSARCPVRWCWTGSHPHSAFWSGSTLDCCIWAKRHKWWDTHEAPTYLQFQPLTEHPRASASKGIDRIEIHYHSQIWNRVTGILERKPRGMLCVQWSKTFRPQKDLQLQTQNKSSNQLSWLEYHLVSTQESFPLIMELMHTLRTQYKFEGVSCVHKWSNRVHALHRPWRCLLL